MGWSIWYAYAGASPSAWSDGCKYEDIWTWAAERQASPPPQPASAGVDADNRKYSHPPLSGISVYPNPFNMSATITFAVAARSDVEVAVYDTLGRQVRLLATKNYAVGLHHLVWDGRNDNGALVTLGLYFVKMSMQGMDVSNKTMSCFMTDRHNDFIKVDNVAFHGDSVKVMVREKSIFTITTIK